MDFFVVPTVTYKVLFVLVILAHERRRVVHVSVTEHPTAEWTAQQVVDAFPSDEAPRHLLRDRDRIYRWRTHLSLGMDCPEPRPVQPPEYGKVIAVPEIDGLHHHCERRVA